MWATSNTMPTKVKTRLPRKHVSNNSSRWRLLNTTPTASTPLWRSSTCCRPASSHTQRDTSLSKRNSFSRFSTTVLPMCQTVRFISTWKNTTRNTTTACSPAATSTMCAMPAASSTAWAKSATRSTSRFGRKPSRNTLCAGRRPGAMVSPVGTANAPRWAVNISAPTSTSTVAAWTSCSRTMNAKSRRLWLRKATRW